MTYKLIALDLDGTLLNSDNKISTYTKSVLEKLDNMGKVLVIATGRSYTSLKPKIESLELKHPVVCYNGAMIRDGSNDEIIYNSTLKTSISKELINLAREYNIHFHGFIDGDFHYENETEYSELYRSVSGLPGVKINFNILNKYDFTKGMFIGEPEKLKIIEDIIRPKFSDDCFIAYSKPVFLEVMDIGASKSNALKRVADSLNIKREEIIAFGDGQNDEDMLEYAGHGVIMKNGFKPLRERFNLSKFTNDEDGVAKYLEELINE